MFASDSLRSAVAVAALLLIGSTATAQSGATGANAVPADLVQAAQQRPVVPSAPAVVVATPAPPAPATPPAMRNSVSASEIALINERMSVMQATLAELELQVKMATKRDELRKLNSGPIVADDGFTPSVVEIGGMDGKLTANLMMQGGNVQAVRLPHDGQGQREQTPRLRHGRRTASNGHPAHSRRAHAGSGSVHALSRTQSLNTATNPE